MTAAAEHHGHLWVPGTWVLRDLIEHSRNTRSADEAVRSVLAYDETILFALGVPGRGDAAHLLHTDVLLLDGSTLHILPVFTSVRRAMQAIEMSPAWGAFHLFEVSGPEVLRDLELDDWLAIDVYTPGEFKLPPQPPA
jgi:hypothetical protein